MEPLFPKVFEWENLLDAWEKVEENDGSPGVDGVTIERYGLELEENLRSLQRDLGSGAYRPQPLLRIYVEKPSGGQRPLAIPTVRDRVAQEAVALVITPLLDREFEASSFGYRRGHSVAQAVYKLKEYREQGYTWVVDAAIKVDQIFVFGNCSITTPAMTYCLKEDIPIVLLSSRGSYYGIIDSPIGDNVSLHREQFAKAADPAFCLATAKAIVRGKFYNCRVLLQRHNRTKRIPEVATAIEELAKGMEQVGQAATLEEVHGYEGAGVARYFEALGHLVDPDLGFARRVRRPPTDPVNSLLSFGYTLLFYNIYALVSARGLHPYVDHLHLMRDRHPSLASDLIEEFRAPIVDALVLYLVNSKIIGKTDFSRAKDETGPCLLTDGARKTFLKHFEQKMGTKVTHPHTGYMVDWRRCIDLQVYKLR